jgi:uncharacterized protein
MLKWLIGTAIAFGGFVALMHFAQRSLMYFPDTMRVAPAAAGLAAAEEVVLETTDGEKIVAWHVPPRDGRPLVIYFHGNGGALAHRAARFRSLTEDGTGLLAVSYRGYGGSTGKPTEDGLIADAVAAYVFATARYPADRIVLFGESLGTGVAVALAAERKVGGVILQAPFTSAVDIGALAYPFLPVRLLMKDQFRSDLRIGEVKAPLLVIHGELDRVIPLRYGERLFALANEPKRMARVPRGDHNDLDSYGVLAEVRAFLANEAR